MWRKKALYLLLSVVLFNLAIPVRIAAREADGQEFNSPVEASAENIETIQDTVKYTVTFDSMGGSKVEDQTVEEGGRVSEPENPVKKGYIFDGWCIDKQCNTFYEFYRSEISESITLYAKWHYWLNDYSYKIDPNENILWLTKFEEYLGESIVPSTVDIEGVTYKTGVSGGCYRDVSIGRLKLEPGVIFAPDSSEMFMNCYGELDLAGVDTSRVTDMSYMFCDAGVHSVVVDRADAILDLSSFDTSKVTDMSYMFTNNSFNTLDLSSFDTSNVTNMRAMFKGCLYLESIDVSGFDTSKVTGMSYMFYGEEYLNVLDVSKFDTSSVTNMKWMFGLCPSLESLDVSGFDTSKVTDMGAMFEGCGATTLDVSGFDTSNVTDMNMMFACEVTSLDVSGFDTSNVTNMNGMFGCPVTSLDVSGFDTSKVTDMGFMFSGTELTSLDLSNFNTSKVTNMSAMFGSCDKLTSVNLRSFNTKNVKYVAGMFASCESLAFLDLSGFDLSKAQILYNDSGDAIDDPMLSSCEKLQILQTPKNLPLEMPLDKPMYDSSGKIYTSLPKNSPVSITLYSTETPEPKEETCQVTFYTGRGMEPIVQTVKKNEKAEKPSDPENPWFTFMGWYVDKDQTDLYDFDAPVTNDIILYAKWSEYHRVYILEGAEALKDGKSVSSVGEGETVTIRFVKAPEGMEFSAWKLTGAEPEDNKALETTFVMGDGDVTVSYELVKKDGTVYLETLPEDADRTTKVKGLKFAKTSLKLRAGDTVSNPAAPTYDKTTELQPAVLYVSSNTDIVGVSPDGTFAAIGGGTATVTAYCGNKKATCKVTVSTYTSDIVILDENERDITDGSYQMKGGEQAILQVLVLPVNSTDPRKVTWKSYNTKAVTVSNGLITAKEVKEPLEAKVTATVTYTEPSGKSAKLTKEVTVKVAPVSVPKAANGDKSHSLAAKLKLAKLETTGEKQTTTLTATLAPAKGSGLNRANISFSSSNEDILMVRSSGEPGTNAKGAKEVVSEVTAVGSGTAYVIVKTWEDGDPDKANIKLCKVTVTSPVDSLFITGDSLGRIDPTSGELTLRLGSYDQILLNVSPQNATTLPKIQWSASGGITVKDGMVFAKSVTKQEKPGTLKVKCGKVETTLRVIVVP
ncbi:MAG: BspA family leucine-rich repeat surface protein [Lachnospiraceae bacterium]|nr:BspA family leucine-rich repeat surface protein [Lachnospiraceae bacterium]